MLQETLNLFKAELEAHLDFIGAEHKTISFPSKAVSQEDNGLDSTEDQLKMMMINLEEETIMGRADRYVHEQNGKNFPGFPEIRLNLYLLFVADLGTYETSMRMLSEVIRFFQARRILDARNVTQMPAGIERLSVELITLPFAEQNDIWNALRSAYKPSLLYKVNMLVFEAEEPSHQGPKIEEKTIITTR